MKSIRNTMFDVHISIFLEFLFGILKRQTHFASRNLFRNVIVGPGTKNRGRVGDWGAPWFAITSIRVCESTAARDCKKHVADLNLPSSPPREPFPPALALPNEVACGKWQDWLRSPIIDRGPIHWTVSMADFSINPGFFWQDYMPQARSMNGFFL